jgi:hypothetical protein
MRNSIGPRTPRGKARSSQNAAKHWIESGRILPEEQRETAILRSGFAEDFKPEGLIEHEVIDDLTLNRLIKRRIDMAFTREFSKAAIEKATRRRENADHSVAQYWLRRRGCWWQDQRERLRPEICIAALERLKRLIGERGPQPQDLETLRAAYGDQLTGNAAFAVYKLIPVAAAETEQEKTPQVTRQKDLKKEILDALQTEIEVQKAREQHADEVSEIEIASDLQEPASPALDTLLRYRAANLREFKDLLDNLGRIRRLRLRGV